MLQLCVLALFFFSFNGFCTGELKCSLPKLQGLS